jgi:hypothetical protein
MVTSPAVSAPESNPHGLDFLGSRRLSVKEEWFWYIAAGVSYVLASVWHKFLLNWFLGPLWLVAFIVLGPALWDRVRWRFRRRPGAADAS